jgi:hypothetical protein
VLRNLGVGEPQFGYVGWCDVFLGQLAAKLPISRWQGGFADSTVLRNLGVGELWVLCYAVARAATQQCVRVACACMSAVCVQSHADKLLPMLS